MTKTIRTAALGMAALAAALAAPAAQAATSVHVQIGPSPYYPAYSQPGYVVTGPQYYHAPQQYRHKYPHNYHRSYRDQDRDGIPNRWDRDRDGDGVPNRWDRRPSNPYRY